MAAGGVDEVVGGEEHRAGAGDQLGAGAGDQHAPAIALEERHPEAALELGELGAERRLRDPAAGGGAVEGELVGDRADVLELAEREREGGVAHRGGGSVTGRG